MKPSIIGVGIRLHLLAIRHKWLLVLLGVLRRKLRREIATRWSSAIHALWMIRGRGVGRTDLRLWRMRITASKGGRWRIWHGLTLWIMVLERHAHRLWLEWYYLIRVWYLWICEGARSGGMRIRIWSVL